MNDFSRSNHVYFLCIGIIFLLAIPASSLYRGIAHDEGLGGYYGGAMKIFNGEPLIDPVNGLGDYRNPARLIYMICIALGFKLVGMNLLALHLFPFLIQLFNPVVFFIVAHRFYSNIWWALGGTLLFFTHPFDVVFLNQQYSSPFFMFFLLVLMLLFQLAIDQPKYLVFLGCIASLLLYTRFEDGVIFVSGLYLAYILQRWNDFPKHWFAASIGSLLLTHILVAWFFGFTIFYPYYEILRMLEIQEGYGGGLSFLELTVRAIKNFLVWFFGGKFASPVIIIFSLIGALTHLRKKIFFPLCLFVPYILFLLFVYNGRNDILMIVQPQIVAPFLFILLSGIQQINIWGNKRAERKISANRPQTKGQVAARAVIFPVSAIVIIAVIFAMKASQLGLVFQDGIPASTMWRIASANPPLPGHPLYKKATVRLTPEFSLPLKNREEVYRSVLGKYRPEGFEVIGKYTKENHLFETMTAQADFSYIDTYDSKERWEADRRNFAGDSTLWNDECPGKLGAFPLHASGSFEYHFTFPKQIEYVIIQDTHSQWGPKDRMRLWTSSDGKNWTVRYGDSRARYKSDQYYQFFDSELDGQTALFIKYEFYAGDAERKGNDNRGASLDEFGLLVKYRQ